MVKPKKIVILGGGSGGIMAANRLRKEIGRGEAEITVIERNQKHVYQPGFLTLLFDLERPEDLFRNVSSLLAGGIDLVTDEVERIGTDGGITTRRNGTIPYDYLVIATGAALDLDEPDGMREGLDTGRNVFCFYTLEYALKLRDALRSFNGGAIVSCIADMPVKCPAAPVAFILLAEEEMKKRGIRERCRFVLTVPTPLIPPGREPFTGALEKVLRERDIEVVADFTLSALESEKGVCRDFLGREVPFDLLCVTPPHTGEKVVLAAKELADPSGWVMCDKNKLEHKKFDNIYAVGDAGNFPSAKAASAARKQAYVLSKRIKAHIAGGVPAEVYDGNAICPVLTSFGRAMFAEFDYDRSISQAKESASKWLLHVRYFRRLYWHFLLKGRFFD